MDGQCADRIVIDETQLMIQHEVLRRAHTYTNIRPTISHVMVDGEPEVIVGMRWREFLALVDKAGLLEG